MAINRRGKILINKSFQLRFTLYVCSWLIGLSIAYPITISTLFSYMIAVLSMDPNAPQIEKLFEVRDDFLRTVLMMQGATILAIAVISLFMSHRIAGPLYKLKKFFKEAKDGNIQQVLTFRKADYFQELVPAYNEMMTSISERVVKHEQATADSIPKIEKILKQCSPEVQHELKEVLAALRSAGNAS